MPNSPEKTTSETGLTIEQKPPNRRGFLKGAAGIVGGVIASTFIEGVQNPNRLTEMQHLNLPEGEGIDTGIGHADFQVQPLPLGKEPVTDWEKALVDTQTGINTRIRGSLDNLPDFHHDYKKHIDVVADDLNNTMFRMSLDFGRLCPKEGEFNHELMGQYIRMIAYCRKRGLQPMVTLHHWPMPLSFCEIQNPKDGKIQKGAWEHPEILKHFRFYIENIIQYFMDPNKVKAALESDPEKTFNPQEIDETIEDGMICKNFITINEPMMHVLTYWGGDFPPFKRGEFTLAQEVLKKLVTPMKLPITKCMKLLRFLHKFVP